jgi:glyoxylase-like metal-dependent hydrolase (beta-lactamase superfamily II)
VRITDEVYVVGGGVTNAFGLSDDPDCHVYLVDGGGEMALIDCGMASGDSLQRIMSNVSAEGLDPEKITKIVVTHYHMDHAGGAARFRERLGVEVVAPVDAAPALRTGDERAVALDVAKAAGFYAADYRFEPVEVGQVVHEGDRIPVGHLELEVIHDCSIQKSAASIAKLARLEFDALLPGHAAICLDGGMRHVAIANTACQSLFVPKNLVG